MRRLTSETQRGAKRQAKDRGGYVPLPITLTIAPEARPTLMQRDSRGGGLIRFLIFVVVLFMCIGPLLRCAQQLPQMAANTAAHAASGVTGAAGNALSAWGRGLLNRVKSLFSGVRDQWDNADPAGKFDLVCEHTQVEGVDKLCPYFTSALQGASDAQTAQIACYWHAAATGPNPQQTLQTINSACSQTAGNPSRLQSCLAQYVEPGDASNCLASSPQQLWPELHTMIKPIACPPGLPESLCTTQSASGQSSSASAAPPDTSAQTRTDPNYLNCLQYYYQKLPAYNQQLSCGTTTNAQNAACVRQTLQSFSYQGQAVGANQVAYCNGMPQ